MLQQVQQEIYVIVNSYVLMSGVFNFIDWSAKAPGLRMSGLTYSARALLLGLALAQIIATVQVYLSNVDVYRSIVALRDTGFLIVPNQRTLPTLQKFSPAFFGGFFFTCSIGTLLSTLSLAAVWGWKRLLGANRHILLPFFLIWLGSLVIVNREFFSPAFSSYLLIIPPVVFVATARWMPQATEQGGWPKRLVHGIPVMVLTLLYASQLDGSFFVDFRDTVLLSNSLGKKLNDFYYNYTLYPAELFKSLDQRLLKTCNLEDLQERPLARSVEQALLEFDYLPVRGKSTVDLKLLEEGGYLAFANRGNMVLRSGASDFLSAPGRVLTEFSARSDPHALFRRFTFLSLVVGLPITLYLLLFGLSRLVCSPFLEPHISSVTATILCFTVGMSLLVPPLSLRAAKIDGKHLPEALQSRHWEERVTALRLIEEKKLELADFHTYKNLLTSPHIAERYWVVRALGVSRQRETYQVLIRFLDDPDANVVSMAFYALGRRRNAEAVDVIRGRLETSDHWYNQWYAYRALRTLGWKQASST